MVEVRNEILLGSFGTFIGLLLSIYLCIPCQNNIDLPVSFSRCKIKYVFYISLFASSKKFVSQYFIGMVQLLSGTCKGLFQTNVKR